MMSFRISIDPIFVINKNVLTYFKKQTFTVYLPQLSKDNFDHVCVDF